MKELAPEEYQSLLDSNGEISLDELSEDQKIALTFAKLALQSGQTGNVRMKCTFCKGTGWNTNSPFECLHCRGTGGR